MGEESALTADPEQEGALSLCAVCKEIRVFMMHAFCPFLVVSETRLKEREVCRFDFLGRHGVLLVESAEVRKVYRLFRWCSVGVVGSMKA